MVPLSVNKPLRGTGRLILCQYFFSLVFAQGCFHPILAQMGWPFPFFMGFVRVSSMQSMKRNTIFPIFLPSLQHPIKPEARS